LSTKASKGKRPTAKATRGSEGKGIKRKRGGDDHDDTPRKFKRLMAFAEGRKFGSGEDNGTRLKGKKSKSQTSAPAEPDKEIPKIKPGEKMWEFAARVNQELPLSAAKNTGKKGDALGLKVRLSKRERKIQKLQSLWREEDEKLKEKREEELELAEEEELEKGTLGWEDQLTEAGGGKRKKAKRGRYIGESTGKEADPWEELKRKRGESKIGLHDVVKAPPQLKKIKKESLLVRGAAVEAAGIPKSAGSLRRREELQELRDDVLSSYRKMMERKKTAIAREQSARP
jgi:hypothetical protein